MKRSWPTAHPRIWITLFLFLCSCTGGNESLKRLDKLGDITVKPHGIFGNFCTLPPESSTARLKFLFVIDYSGSNIETDPTGDRRFGAILDFMARPDLPNAWFALISFADAATVLSPFTADRAAFAKLIDDQHALNPHDGNTNFTDALARSQALIAADAEASRGQVPSYVSQYVVFFISDGFPTVGGLTKAEILPAVDSLIALQDTYSDEIDSIQLNTGHYYIDVPDADAESLMREMALHGGGQFKDFDGDSKIDLSSYTLSKRRYKHRLKEIFVRNLSTVWKGNRLLLDSDHDGLADEDEVRLGSDPHDPDSDHNGVNDSVEEFITGTPCHDGYCAAANAAVYTQCLGLPGSSTTGAPPNFPDAFGDGLNLCEKRLLGLDPSDFDANRDYIPDGLAFRSKVAFRKGELDAFLDPDWDSVINYLEVKGDTPTDVPNDHVLGLKPYSYHLDITSDGDDQTCYGVEVQNIESIGDDNIARVYIVESVPARHEEWILRTADLPLIDGRAEFVDKGLGVSQPVVVNPGAPPTTK